MSDIVKKQWRILILQEMEIKEQSIIDVGKPK